jgi:hypothetical protein
MLLELLVAATLSQNQVRTLELSRGALIPSQAGETVYRYWDTEDTTLDEADPEAARGGEPTVIGGSSKVILIRFGDLERALGKTRHVRNADLVFTVASGGKPTLISVSRVLVPWGQGPMPTINTTLVKLEQQSTTLGKDQKSKAPRLSATWRSHLSGADKGAWQEPGAKGVDDSVPIQGATLESTDKEVTIDGLGTAIQYLADHPSQNYGLAIQLGTDAEFFSGRSDTGRPKLELELDEPEPAKGPDLCVSSIDRNGDTYTAHVANIGQGMSGAFSYHWSINGKAGATTDSVNGLDRLQSVAFTLTPIQRAALDDHRALSIGFHIAPKGPDSDPTDDDLEVQANAIRLSFAPPNSKAIPPLETPEIAVKLQRRIRTFNDVYLANSRFSFAPDGAKERVAFQSSGDGDASVILDPAMLSDAADDVPLLKAMARAIGLVDLSRFDIKARSGAVDVPGADERGVEDPFGGLMGGDTRFEGSVLASVSIPNEPVFDPDNPQLPLEATGLLSMTDVYALNANLGKPITGAMVHAEPKTLVVRARDLQGRPLANTSLAFYRSKDWRIPKEEASITLKLGDSGVGVLAGRPGGIFDGLAPDGSNGLMLVGATANGMTEWTWLKAWQLSDMVARGNALTGIYDFYFNLPGAELDSATNRAQDRIVTDSTGQGVDKLAAITDGDPKTVATLGSKPGDWVEVDLGRDRTCGEIKIAATESGFWKSFDIVVYGTGQRPEDAVTFARELDWAHTVRTRSDGPAGASFVAYRGKHIQIRFIRIVSRSGGPARIGEIQATPIKVAN